MKKIIIAVFSLGMVLNVSVNAEERTLTGEEVQALFAGKTFDGYNENRGKSYKAYSDPDGVFIHKNTKRTKETTWEVDSRGRHCVKFKKKYCGKIISVGDGVYHKMKRGEHANTLTNFVEGNKL